MFFFLFFFFFFFLNYWFAVGLLELTNQRTCLKVFSPGSFLQDDSGFATVPRVFSGKIPSYNTFHVVWYDTCCKWSSNTYWSIIIIGVKCEFVKRTKCNGSAEDRVFVDGATVWLKLFGSSRSVPPTSNILYFHNDLATRFHRILILAWWFNLRKVLYHDMIIQFLYYDEFVYFYIMILCPEPIIINISKINYCSQHFCNV